MKGKSWKWIAGGVVVFTLLFAVLVSRQLFSPWWSGASDRRHADAWEQSVVVTRPAPSQIEVSDFSTPGEAHFFFTNPWPSLSRFLAANQCPLSVTGMSKDQPIHLESIAVVAGSPAPVMNRSMMVNVEAQYFNGLLEPVSGNHFERRFPGAWQRFHALERLFPMIRFDFRVGDGHYAVPLAFHLVDARTQKKLQVVPHRITKSGDFLHFEATLPIWHPAPVDAYFDIAWGGIQYVSLEPQAKASVSLPYGSIELVGIAEQTISAWTQRDTGDTVTIRIPQNDKAAGSRTIFAFSNPFGIRNVPVTFEGFDKFGQPLRSLRLGVSSNSIVTEIAATRSRISSLSVAYHTRITRFVLKLPELPGLPSQNRGLRNLFETRIPAITFWGINEMPLVVSSIVQMDLVRPKENPVIPPGYFPRHFDNASAADILEAYLALFPTPRQPKINDEEFIIELPPQFLHEWKQRFITWWEK